MHSYSREMLILNRATGRVLTDVFEKPADEEPSILYGGLTSALGAVAFTGGVVANEFADSFDIEYSVSFSGALVGAVGLYEIYLAARNRRTQR